MGWHNFAEHKPVSGIPVIVTGKFDAGTSDRDIAYYFDGDFYKLGLDPVLGALRKQLIEYPVLQWTEIYIG